MRNLILFIKHHNYFFLFLLLEGLAIFIVVRKNYHHSNVYIQSSGRVIGAIHETAQGIREYFQLEKQNLVLAKENARLRNASKLAYMQVPNYTIAKEDTVYRRYMEFIPAKVVSAPVSQRNNNWMINKGSRDGLEQGMGVVSPNGLVGIIVEVSNNYSLIHSMLHSHTKISVMLKKNQHKGFMLWPGGNYREGIVSDIPAHVDVKPGDTIVTSGQSLIFPENIVTGTVIDSKRIEGEGFLDIQITFSEDYNNTRHVYVIKNLMIEEQEALKETVSHGN